MPRIHLLQIAYLLILLGSSASAAKPNILFIAVDDLRPELSCYGRSHIHSPNIDRLANTGVLFERAYCMVPTCGASRASLMTGLRPSRDRFKNYLAWAEKDAPGVTTLNTHFKQHGYTTVSLGKIFHHKTDNLQGWSKAPWRPSISDWHDRKATQAAIRLHKQKHPRRDKVRGPPVESFEATDNEYRDGELASKAIKELELFAQKGLTTTPEEPFFLAVGFYKPHLPFCAPKKYWDLYDPSEIKLPKNDYAPKDAPPGAVHTSGELRAYATIPPKGPVTKAQARQLIHGYYACVSFIDAQIGRVLDRLKELNLEQNTIVVLWGDHGWQLGEHGMWNKHSCFETSMHAPLLIRTPNHGLKNGTRVTSLVEFIDIYPTLCELADLDPPKHLEGSSLIPLLTDTTSPWKPYAVGRFKNGDTIRSDTHRYSEYCNARGTVQGRMLYDHRTDPGENVNVASTSKAAVESLTEELNSRKGK